MKDPTAEAFRIVADDLRRTADHDVYATPLSVATDVTLATDDLGYEVELAEVIAHVLVAKYDEGADVLDSLAEAIEKENTR